jgi:hypothetical protein
METAYNANLPPVDDLSWDANTNWGFDDPIYHRYAGPFGGGNTLTITGDNFGGYEDLTVQDVKIGTTSCTTTGWVSATSLECVVPSVGTLGPAVQVSHGVEITVGQYTTTATNPYIYDCPCAQDALSGNPGCFIPEYNALMDVYECTPADLCVNDGTLAGSEPWLPDPNCTQTWRTCLSDPVPAFSGAGIWKVCGDCDTTTHPAAVEDAGECVCDTGYFRNTGVNSDIQWLFDPYVDGCESSSYCTELGTTDESDCACQEYYDVGSVYDAPNQWCWCDSTRNFAFDDTYSYCECSETYFFNSGYNQDWSSEPVNTCVASTNCAVQGSMDTDDCACMDFCVDPLATYDAANSVCSCPAIP